MGDEAMNNGNYQQAIDYYSKAFDQNQSDDITKKINFAQNLKKEFDEIDIAINSGNFTLAEAHINNLLMIDPSNKFIESKRQLIKQKQSQNSSYKRQRRWSNFADGFKGDDDFHEMLGGFHFRSGISLIDMTKIDNTFDQGYAIDLYYNNSNHFPITLDLGCVIGAYDYQTFNLGVNSSYNFSKRFTLDYGIGYQWGNIWSLDKNLSNPFYKLGCTLMFNGKNWGGLNYSYIHGLNNAYPISTHNITYIFGREPTKFISSLALIVGLIALGASAQ
jgi:tetratricopeptide (TPR) repeat protein